VIDIDSQFLFAEGKFGLDFCRPVRPDRPNKRVHSSLGGADDQDDEKGGGL